MGTINSAKSGANWRAKAPMCSGCRHLQQLHTGRDYDGPFCQRHGFYTRNAAVCDSHETEFAAGVKEKLVARGGQS